MYIYQIAPGLLSLHNHLIKPCPYPRFQAKVKLSVIAAYCSLDCLLSRQSRGKEGDLIREVI